MLQTDRQTQHYTQTSENLKALDLTVQPKTRRVDTDRQGGYWPIRVTLTRSSFGSPETQNWTAVRILCASCSLPSDPNSLCTEALRLSTNTHAQKKDYTQIKDSPKLHPCQKRSTWWYSVFSHNGIHLASDDPILTNRRLSSLAISCWSIRMKKNDQSQKSSAVRSFFMDKSSSLS